MPRQDIDTVFRGVFLQERADCRFIPDNGECEKSIDFIGRGGFWAIVVIEALHLYPIAYLNVTAALANLEAELGELQHERERRLNLLNESGAYISELRTKLGLPEAEWVALPKPSSGLSMEVTLTRTLTLSLSRATA